MASSQESCCCGCTRYKSVRNLLTFSLVFSHNVRLMGRSRALLPPTAARNSTSWDTNMVNTPQVGFPMKVTINETNWTPNQYTEYPNLYI